MEKHALTKLRIVARICGALQILSLVMGAIWLAGRSVELMPGGSTELVPPFRLTPIEPNQYTFVEALFYFLIPALVLAIVFVASLKWELVGAIGFAGFGAVYMLYMVANHSIPPILFSGIFFPGPALLSGVLYLITFWFNMHTQQRHFAGT